MADTEADWQLCDPIFAKTLIDRSRSQPGPLMRRRINGEWEYRRCDPGEIAEYNSQEAW